MTILICVAKAEVAISISESLHAKVTTKSLHKIYIIHIYIKFSYSTPIHSSLERQGKAHLCLLKK